MAGLPTDYNKWEKINASIEPDEEELALQRLKQQKADMTEEEVRRLHNCWEKPEFKAMFQEYADEVSDPKNKAEQEAYLAQCEAEQRAQERAKQGFLGGRSAAEFDSLDAAVPGRPDGPEGSKLLKPNKGFVIKTWKREAGKKDFDRERGKLFINVCSHDEIDAPTSQDVTAPDGRQGQTWSMPHLCSPAAKEEKDKAGHVCSVIDIVFNTLVLSRTEDPLMGERWKEMVCKTALDMVAKLHELDLDADGHKVLGTKYFGPSTASEGCSTMAWKPEKAFEQQPDKPRTNAAEKKSQKKKKAASEAAAAAAAGGVPNLPNMTTVDLAKESGDSSSRGGGGGGGGGGTSSKPAVSAGFLNKPAASAKPDLRAKATAAERERVAPMSAKVRAPKFTIVHRGVGDMSAAWNDSNLAQTTRPRELLVKVELPELGSAADIDLDITERRLELTHEGARYQLSLPLPFPVLSEQGSAKFDKAKHILSVTLPVAASAAPKPVWEPEAKGQTDEERAAEEAAEKAAAAEEKARKEEEQRAAKEAEKAAREAKLKLEEEERERRRAAAVAQAEREAARRAAAAAKADKDKKRQINEAKAADAAAPAPPPAIKSVAAPPPAAPTPAAPKAVDTTAANAAAAKAAAEAAAKKPADSEGSDRGSESEWVNVSEAEAEAAKASSPSKPEAGAAAKKGFTEAAAKPPPKPAAKVVDITEPPAAPTGQQPPPSKAGVPAFSNGLLFELD